MLGPRDRDLLFCHLSEAGSCFVVRFQIEFARK